jgi:hypothetical protein
MKGTYTMLLAITTVLSLTAPEFRSVKNLKEYLYTTPQGQLYGLGAVALLLQGDSVCTLPTAKGCGDFNCYDAKAPGWCGRPIRLAPDGTTAFYNHADEPIEIWSRAAQGTSPIAWEGSSGRTLLA